MIIVEDDIKGKNYIEFEKSECGGDTKYSCIIIYFSLE